ncbi:MAG: hypothetical protein ABI441_10915 [Flavobacterium sp.]
MKFLEIFSAIPKIFDWYFGMESTKRIQLNFIVVLMLLFTYIYYTNKAYADNITILANRLDTANDSRAKEQEKYTAKLEYYTDKFSELLFKLDKQKEELKQIKDEK